MRFSGSSILAILLMVCCNAPAADPPAAHVADSVVMKAARAQCWDQGTASVVELNGPVHIELDGTKMSADNAVVWINPNPDGPADSHQLQIALVGNGQLQQEGVLRLDRRLLVNAVVTGNIQLVGDRAMGTDESSDLYVDAAALRAGKPSTSNPVAATNPATTTAPALPETVGSRRNRSDSRIVQHDAPQHRPGRSTRRCGGDDGPVFRTCAVAVAPNSKYGRANDRAGPARHAGIGQGD